MSTNKQDKSPGLVKWIVARLVRKELVEEFLGDLEEMYEERVPRKGAAYAKLMYCVDAIHLLAGFASVRIFKERNTSTMMYNHYILTAFRSLARTKVYSTISIASLAIGMGVCLTICQYLFFELSYDASFENSQNTYRLAIDKIKPGGETYPYPYETGYAVGPSAKTEIPEILQYVRLHKYSGGAVVTNPDDGKPFAEDALNILFVDGDFLQVFDFPLDAGHREALFRDKYSIVITRQMAQKYFGSSDPLGKVLTLAGGVSPGNYVVTGVTADLPLNSHVQFRFLLPIENYLDYGWGGAATSNDDGWSSPDCATYFTLSKSADIALVTRKLDQLIAKYQGDKETVQKAALQPIMDIHLRSDPGVDPGLVKNSGSILTVTFFSIIAIFILVVAWVNYINLSTARSIHRTKEVGVRKSIGANKKQLVVQFMVESFVTNLVAGIISIGLASLILPLLTRVLERQFEFTLLKSPVFWLSFLALIAIGSVFSGLFPAFVLSSFKPISMLGSNKLRSPGGFGLRRGLITFQFLVSILLISGTYLVYKQVKFMKTQELGMDIETILVLKGPAVNLNRSSLESTLQTFREKVRDHNTIVSVAASSSVPGKGYNTGLNIRRLGAPAGSDKFGRVVFTGPDIEQTYDLEFVAGQPPTPEMLRQKMVPVVINEEAVRTFGIGTPENAIQEELYYKDDTFRISGVVKNFHWHSLADAQTPYLFEFYADCSTYFSFKMNLSNIPGSLAHIQETYETFFPGNPFDYFFLEDEFNRQYKEDVQFGNLVLIFTILAIFIACIGLFALVSYSAALKIKEIGIRKVMGASVSNIMMLLSRDYLIPLMIANILAIPAVFYWGTRWLENYAFRTGITIELFLIPGTILVAVSFLTVSYRTFVAACANPVESLRTE